MHPLLVLETEGRRHLVPSPLRSGSHLPSSVCLGVPVSHVSLEMRAPRGQVIEGGDLVLLCSVAEGTGNITFSWHREATGRSVGRKTQRSLSAELEVPAVQERDAGRYYCRADNGHGPIQSKVLSILVRSELLSDSAQTETPKPRPRSWESAEGPGVSRRQCRAAPTAMEGWVTLAS